MAYPPTQDLTDSNNVGVRFFEVEDSLGSYSLVRRQLTVSASSPRALADIHEGHWVVPSSTLDEYETVAALLADNVPAYVVASLSGSQGDVLESGGVTGLQGDYIGLTKVYEVGDAYSPGDLLTLNLVDIGDGAGAVHSGLVQTGATAANAVAVVEFFDAANGVLKYRVGTR